MKTRFTYLWMVLLAMTMALAFTGCSKDDEEKGDGLEGTRWIYTDVYTDGTVEYIISFFSGNSATYEISVKNTGGTITNSETIRYTYQRSEDLVIFSTQQAGKANLEGEISSGIKMELTNTSTSKVIGVFYKK